MALSTTLMVRVHINKSQPTHINSYTQMLIIYL
jgi:hypothetical protein